MELKRCGDTIAHVLKTAGWNSGTFRAYLPIVEDEEADILLILRNRDGGSSEDESQAAADSPSSISPTSESL